MSEKKLPSLKQAAASTLVILIFLGWVTWKADQLRHSGPGSDDVNVRIVRYEVSKSGGVGGPIKADVWFYDGNTGQYKEDVTLPVTYEVALSPGTLAKVTADANQTDDGGELDCDIWIGETHAAWDGDELERVNPNVECSAVVS